MENEDYILRNIHKGWHSYDVLSFYRKNNIYSGGKSQIILCA